MAYGIATVWVPVQDIDRAVAFYRDTLGLTVKSQDGDWAEVTADGLTIGLNARETATSGAEG
ncbi:VOC family protein, partial [Solicola sp. PLA-1-18]|uniref:VOC family protein n=1 Tax=Solicola sp. PLA-1-18 TaxID=3380532 RepID=UPI003B771F1F